MSGAGLDSLQPGSTLFPTAEKVSSLGKNWHRFCLKCERCHNILSPGGHAEVRPGQGDSPLSHPYPYSPQFPPWKPAKGNLSEQVQGDPPIEPPLSQNLAGSVMLLSLGFEGGVSSCPVSHLSLQPLGHSGNSDLLAYPPPYQIHQTSCSAHMHLTACIEKACTGMPLWP